VSVHFSSATDLWATPQDFFDKCAERFAFDLDVCATPDNAKCASFFTAEQDGLAQPWRGVCWMNPPYGRLIGKWMRKAYESSLAGATIICLVPARTDTAWWHDYAVKGEVEFIRGRLKFGGSANSAPFPSEPSIARLKSSTNATDEESTGANAASRLAGGILNVIAKAASDPNTDVDKLERLLAMQERVLEREAEQRFNVAMREAQEEMGPVLKNKSNKETHSTYADLEQSAAHGPDHLRHGFSLSFGTADCPYPNHYRVTCDVSHTGGFSKHYQADVPVDNTGPKGSQNKTTRTVSARPSLRSPLPKAADLRHRHDRR
jgi:phage N-6-adenine-methyltransferase